MGFKLNPLGSPFDIDNVGTGGGGVTDHGALTGLADDDHPQYALNSALATVATSGSHLDLSNIGTNTHATIDTHLANNNIHVPSMTAGSVAFHNGTILSQDAAGFGYDSTNKILITNGTAAFAAAGVLVAGPTTLYPKNMTVSTATSDRNFAAFRFSSTGAPTNVNFRARGTSGAPTTIVSGDAVGRYVNYGFDGSSYVASSQLTFGTSGTISAGIVPGFVEFFTANSSGALTSALVINSSQVCAFVNQPTGINFSGLGDVTLTSPANGDTLRYNSSTSRWNNSTRLKVTDQVSIEPATPSGTFPYAFLADHAGTNLVNNPSFEVNITDFWTSTGTPTLTRDTTEKWIGSASLKIVSSADNSGVVSSTIPISASTTYVFSCYAKGSAGGEQIYLSVDPDAGATRHSSNQGGFEAISIPDLLTTDWSRITLSFTSNVSATNCVLYIRSDTATAQTVYIDAVQFEQKSLPTDTNESVFASSYMDGSMGDGYAWTGTAHNSTSTRAAGTKFLAPISSSNNRGNFIFRTDGTIARAMFDAKEVHGGDWQGTRNEPQFPFTFVGNMKTNVSASGILAGVVNVRNINNGTALHVQSQATTAEGFIVSADAVTSGSCMSVFAPSDLTAMQAAGGKFFTFSGKAQNADMYSFYVDKLTIGQLGFAFEKNVNLFGGGSMTTTARALAGTVSVTAASTTVTGAGTAFLTDFKRGQAIRINNGGTTTVICTIASIASNTSLTLTAGWGGTTNAARTYDSFTLQYRPPVIHLEGSYANHGASGTIAGDFMYGIYASGGGGQLHVKRSAALGTAVTPTADHDGHGIVTARQVLTNSGLIFGTTTETTMISGYTINAYELTPGGCFRISFFGQAVIDNSARTLTWRVKLGGTTILTSTAVQMGAVATINFRGVIDIFAPTTTSQICSLSIVGKDGAAVTAGLTYAVNNFDNTGTRDLRIDQALTVTCQADAIGQVIAIAGVTTTIL